MHGCRVRNLNLDQLLFAGFRYSVDTVEAPRHEAGFRGIFGPQNEALQMGYGAGNRPSRVPESSHQK